MTHVSVKFELILSSKRCPNFRVGYVCNDAKQHYTFDLLTPNQFTRWFADLKKGRLGWMYLPMDYGVMPS